MKRKFFSILVGCFLCMAWSAAFAGSYDFFGGFIPEGTPSIDGVLEPGEWDEMGQIRLCKFFGEDSKIEIYLMWDASFLYLGADIQDFELWVDDFNSEEPWFSTWDDDAFKWEIDPDYSRDENLQSSDRVFAINANGSASRFDKGDGSGNTAGASLFDTIKKVVRYSGMLNDHTFKTLSSETQKDKGFTLEVALSWRNVFGSHTTVTPDDGQSLGMNFTHIEDDTGGPMDPVYYEEWKRVSDELTRFMGEEDHPENWAEFIISSKDDATPPAAISNLQAQDSNAFSTRISFTATGDNGSAGYANAYDIRYSTAPLTGANWESATPYKNNFRPRKAGKSESFRIIGLSPETSYYIGVRALDERGNASQLTSTSITTTSHSSFLTSHSKGFLTVDPGRRYLAWENGEPFIVIGDNQGMAWPFVRTFYNGEIWDDSKGRYRNFFQEEGIEDGRDYLKYLSDHGVNTLRIMAESFDIIHPVYLAVDVSLGPDHIVFNQATLNFLETFLDECASYDISVILVPFDTFFYKDKWSKVPFSKTMGGPMSAPSDFFKPEYREYLKAILAQLVSTVGDRENLLAWDIVNEFDSDDPSFGWNPASFEEREATVNALADYLREIDPHHMIYLSSVRWDPRFNAHLPPSESESAVGADAALVLNNSRFDFNSTHPYYHDIRDPNFNAPGNTVTPFFTYQVADQDNTIAPAVRITQGLQFYYAYSLTPKPYFDTEAGPIRFFTSEYDSYFTAEDDHQYFHNMIWAHLASGDVGTGLRWPGEMFHDHALPEKMRKYQLALSHFVLHENPHFDFSRFRPVQIGQYLEISNTNVPIVKTGITDGKQGIIFLVNDKRRSINGNISNAQLSIPKLDANGVFSFEFWDSYDETRTTPTRTVSATSDASGQVSIDLPEFEKTQVIKFYKTEDAEPVLPNGYLVADDLWIRAVIATEEKGDIEAVWQQGGEGETDGGHKVIWGYFHADPSDVSWGSQDNPDLFVKLWFDANGRVDVNFFHVSVPDITVYSACPYDGASDEQGITTMSRRYIRQYYSGGESATEEQYEDGNPPLGYSPSGNPLGNVTDNIRIGAMINTVEKGLTDAVWRLGGANDTAGGHRVVWGYFYADPSDVAWGNRENPDLFVKAWFDAGGRTDVNFFHVSVPDIEVYSDYPAEGGYEQKGTTLMDNRYIRHEYQQ